MGKTLTKEEFVERARRRHGEKYDYSKTEYKDSRLKVCIICPIHGEFWQTPKQHLKTHGCSKCKPNKKYKLSYNEIDGEIWKDIKCFEGLYRISNFGRLMSCLTGEWNVLSTTNSKGDYLSIILRKGEYRKSTRIHRLVYETFVGEIPQGKKYHIHHINGDKQDNRVENLELVSSSQHHIKHLNENPHLIDGMNNYNKYIRPKSVAQCDLNGNIIAIFPNAKEASRVTGVCPRNILQVANKTPFNKEGNIRTQAGGFIWKFVED